MELQNRNDDLNGYFLLECIRVCFVIGWMFIGDKLF